LIDEQHKHLVDIVNDLFRHVSGNVDQEHQYFNDIIQNVENYIKVHFATEEKIMLATKFSGYAEHKKAHENFISTVDNNISEYSSGKRLTLYNFTKFLKNWVLSHIAVMDKQYFLFLKRIAAKKANKKLFAAPADLQSVSYYSSNSHIKQIA